MKKGQVSSRYRILLFEDNSFLRSVLGKLLLQQGWEVYSFPEPEQCPLFHSPCCTCNLPEVCADAIVTDLTMPGMDGFSFVLELSRKGCRISHVAILTDSQDTDLLSKARASGFAVFNKGEGLTSVLHWLKEVQTQSASERQLTHWLGQAHSEGSLRLDSSGSKDPEPPSPLLTDME